MSGQYAWTFIVDRLTIYPPKSRSSHVMSNRRNIMSMRNLRKIIVLAVKEKPSFNIKTNSEWSRVEQKNKKRLPSLTINGWFISSRFSPFAIDISRVFQHKEHIFFIVFFYIFILVSRFLFSIHRIEFFFLPPCSRVPAFIRLILLYKK